jgi:ADP-ribosylglycohydrolase
MVSYVACRGFDPADYAQRIRDMFALNKMVGQGRTTRDAALHLIVGIPWDEAAPPPGRFTAGNGSAMRAAPVGLFFYDHDEKLLEAARCQSIITHRDEKAIAGSIIVSKTVAHVLNGPLDIDALLADLEPAIGRLDPMACLGLQQMRKWLLLPPNQAVQEVRKLNPYPSDRWQWISPLVTTSVMWSLYAFLRTPSDYFESICTAISCGGDVDTTAAMTGAMSGALNGLSAIPTAYAQNLHDKDEWDYERFLTLAADTLKVKLDVAL